MSGTVRIEPHVAQAGGTENLAPRGQGAGRWSVLAPLRSDAVARRVYGAIGIAVVLAVWQLTTSVWLRSSAELAPPSDVISNLFHQMGDGAFWQLVGTTAKSWAVGLLLSVVIGIAAGIIIGSNNYIWHAVRPTLEFMRPIPGIALMPLALLKWGQSTEAEVFLIVFGTVWTLIVQTMYGVRSVDPIALETGRAFGMSRAAQVRWIVLPSSLPYLATGIRIASSVALVIAISAELLIGSPGMGNEIGLSQAFGRYTEMYALILATGLLGVILQTLSVSLEKRALRWHESHRPRTM